MKRLFVALVTIVLLCLGGIAQADDWMPTVHVGNAGNTGDTRIMTADEITGNGGDGTSGYGSVAYEYNIGKYEVTAGQYKDFLNATAKTDTYGLYNADMWNSQYGCKIQQSGISGSYDYSVAADWANRPVNFVSWYDTLRFANWMTNTNGTGTGSADTESGSYKITDGGVNSGTVTITNRNANSTGWFLTSENEWYKAAYYKGGGTNSGYWLYPTKSDIAPSNVGSDGYTDPGNNANYYSNGYTIGGPYYRTNVGEFENSVSGYGTFDQGGNVWEWNEAIIEKEVIVDNGVIIDDGRGLRGGSFDFHNLQSSFRYTNDFKPAYEDLYIGFRVVQAQAVPEPSTFVAACIMFTPVVLSKLRSRRRK